jgi:hypothetical protein
MNVRLTGWVLESANGVTLKILCETDPEKPRRRISQKGQVGKEVAVYNP